MTQTKYTFLLPAYKPDFFEVALRSIKEQTFSDFKVLVSDDCSPHDLKSIFDKVCGDDERFAYRRNEENMGGKSLVSHWNLLVDMCDTEYLILASDDDVYEPTFLEEVDKLARKYPEVDLIRARVRRINENGEIMADDAMYKEVGDAIDYIYQKHFNNGITCMACFTFRTSALKSCGGFENLPEAWHSDDASSLKVCRRGIANTMQTLLNFRTSSVNISGRKITSKDAYEKCKATLLYDVFYKRLINEIVEGKSLTIYKKRQLEFAQKHHDSFSYRMSRTYASLCDFSDFYKVLKYVPKHTRFKFTLYCLKMKMLH